MSGVLNEATIKLIRHAIAFADWAAGEGICPAGYSDPTAAERNPDEFLFAYSSATNDEDWGTVATRISAEIARLQAENEAGRKAQPYVYIGKDGKSVLARDLEDRLLKAEAELSSLKASAKEARAEALEEAAKVCEAEVSGITCDRFIFNGEVAKNDMGDTSFVSITRMSEYLRSQAAAIRRLKEGA